MHLTGSLFHRKFSLFHNSIHGHMILTFGLLEKHLLRISFHRNLERKPPRQEGLCWWSGRFVTQCYIPQEASTTLIWSVYQVTKLFFFFFFLFFFLARQTFLSLSHSFSCSSYHSLSLKTCCHPTFSGIDVMTTVLKYSCFFLVWLACCCFYLVQGFWEGK